MEITEGVRKNMEGMKEHPEFVRNAAPPSTTIHEVVIAIKQLNLVRCILSCSTRFFA